MKFEKIYQYISVDMLTRFIAYLQCKYECAASDNKIASWMPIINPIDWHYQAAVEYDFHHADKGNTISFFIKRIPDDG